MKRQNSILLLFIVIFVFFISAFLIDNIFQDNKLNFDDKARQENYSSELSPSSTEIPTFEWSEIWSGSNTDIGYSVIIDSNEFIYIAGKTDSYGEGGYDMILIKYDPEGNQIWNLTWGGINDDICNDIAIDSLDNIYLVGDSKSFGLITWNVYLVKFNSSGVQLWNQTWGISHNSIEYGRTIAIDSNDDIYLGGYIKEYFADDTDMLIIKYNSNGNQLWNLTRDMGGYERIQDIAFDSSENIIVAGQTSYWHAVWEWDEIEYCVAKFDKDGNYQWHQWWGEWNGDNHLHSICIDSSNNIYISGGRSETRLIKLNDVGNLLWTRTWGNGLRYQCHGMALDQSEDIYLVGMVNHVKGAIGLDMYLLKYNSSGDYQWHQTFGVGEAFALVFDNYENIYISGRRGSDIRLVRFKSFPILEITSPHHHQVFGANSPDFSISVGNSKLFTSWYTVNENITKYYFKGNVGKINQTAWDRCDNGTLSIRFYVNDSLDQIVSKEVIVRKDNLYFPAPVLYSALVNPFEPDNGLISLNWSVETNAIRYHIYRNTSYINSVLGLSAITSTSSSYYTDEISAAGIYHYAIIAEYENSNSSLSNCEFAEVSPYISKIIIDSLGDWITLVSTKYWCTGTGSLIDPFIMNGIIIEGVSGNCIEIKNTNANFIIRDCEFNNATGIGIRLQNVDNGIILNNKIYGNANDAIYITDSSQDNIISFNNISKNQNYGIRLSHSNYNNISDNLITENIAGVSIDNYVQHNRIINNTFINNEWSAVGLTYWASNNFITGNVIENEYNRFIRVRGPNTADQCLYNNIFSNYFNGVLSHTSITIDDNAVSGITWSEAFDYGICTGAGTYGTPYIIKDYIINAAAASYGIKIMNSKTISFIIQNCSIYNSYKYYDSAGITLENTDNGIIIDNICSNNDFAGIKLISSDNNTIVNNTADNNDADSVWGSGLMIKSGSDNNNISGNEASSNIYGIFISNLSNNNSVSNNILISNQYRGIAVGSSNGNFISENLAKNSDYGIHIYINCNYNTIINNTLKNNDYGFYLNDNSQFNVITDNKIISNSVCGFYLGTTTYENLLFLNNFTGNALSAQDSGSNNHWNNTIRGNIWDDYIGSDSDDDGIGDIAYNIAGGSNKDYLPIYWDGDDGAPIIIIDSPMNNTFYSHNPPSYYLIINAIDVDSIWYSLYNGLVWSENNSISEKSGIIDEIMWNLYDDGLIHIIYYANDTYGNLSFKNVSVYKDTISPSVIINSPSYYDLFGIDNPPEFNITVSDSHPYAYWYNLKQNLIETDNVTFIDLIGYIKTGEIDEFIWDQIENGSVTITFYVSDMAGNIAFEEIIFNKDTIIPNISILSPIMNQLCGNNSINFEILIDDLDIHSKWYNLNGGVNFSFNELNGILNQSAWEECGNGTIIITFYTKDFAGNIGFEQVIILKDIISPIITIISPVDNSVFGNATFSFEIEINEYYLNKTWYIINSGQKHFFSGMINIIDTFDWSSYDRGLIEIIFYANDTNDNTGSKKLAVIKDSDPPNITINNPNPNDLFGLDPLTFELVIAESNLNTTWYVLNDGPKYVFSGFSATVNQVAWESFTTGSIIIKFFANDSLGNISFKEIMIHKDISPPITVISFIPHSETNIVNISTPFNLDANDPSGFGILRIEYAINNSNWFTYTNPFNLSSLIEGYYLISYRSIDNGGNVEEINTILVKLIHIGSNPVDVPNIPSFDIMIINILNGLCIVILILKVSNTRKKKN